MTAIAKLIMALLAVESSGGNDYAIGDGGLAHGALQIHPCVVDDVNRIYGTNFRLSDRNNRAASIQMCELYLSYWASAQMLGRDPTIEDMARIWNGGPDGWRKPTTLPHWHRVRRHLPAEIAEERPLPRPTRFDLSNPFALYFNPT